MTGIERLRRLARSQNMDNAWTAMLSHELCDIADQIQREHAEDCFRMGERAAEGKVGPKTRHEMALSLLDDWEREAVERESDRRLGIAADVSMSAYDLLPQEEREAVAWVREHGGLEAVKAHWSGRVPLSNVKRMVELHKKKRDRLKAHALWLERKCAERRETIEELGKTIDDMRPRLMPEGMEWPRFEDGEPVRVGDAAPFGSDDVMEVTGVEINRFGYVLHGSIDGGTRECVDGDEHCVPVKRPAPKVLDADGAEIREKRDVWWICEGDERGFHAERLRVETILPDGLVECSPYNGGTWVSLEPSELYVNKPVPASDGRPLREGDTVWDVDGRGPLTVWRLPDKSEMYVSLKKDGTFYYRYPEKLTHERLETDSWERLEEDAKKPTCDYFGHQPDDGQCEKCHAYTDSTPQGGRGCRYAQMADLVRRAKALAGDA